MDVLRFWLEQGVDGFRVDALRQLVKDEHLRDNPPNPDERTRSPYDALLPLYSTDRPEVHEAVREMRSVLEEYGDRLLIGELYLPIDRLVTYYGENNSGVHLPFNFHLISTPWNAREISTLIDAYEAALPRDGWPTWVLGNHDRSRIASRVGDAQARVAARLPDAARHAHPLLRGRARDARRRDTARAGPGPLREERPRARELGRDPARTPMQWDASPNSGCAPDVEPWLPVADDYRTYNAATEREDPTSMLNLHRRLLALRRSEPALALGSYDRWKRRATSSPTRARRMIAGSS